MRSMICYCCSGNHEYDESHSFKLVRVCRKVSYSLPPIKHILLSALKFRGSFTGHYDRNSWKFVLYIFGWMVWICLSLKGAHKSLLDNIKTLFQVIIRPCTWINNFRFLTHVCAKGVQGVIHEFTVLKGNCIIHSAKNESWDIAKLMWYTYWPMKAFAKR